jgi:hypothetical protein
MSEGVCPTLRVMPGLVPGIYAVTQPPRFQNSNAILGAGGAHLGPLLHVPAWMAGTSPAMTEAVGFHANPRRAEPSIKQTLALG